jgi:hypothetical protein
MSERERRAKAMGAGCPQQRHSRATAVCTSRLSAMQMIGDRGFVDLSNVINPDSTCVARHLAAIRASLTIDIHTNTPATGRLSCRKLATVNCKSLDLSAPPTGDSWRVHQWKTPSLSRVRRQL